GVLHAGHTALPVPEHGEVHDLPGVGYVRPHELDVAPYRPGGEGIVARLLHANAIGPLAQLEFQREDGAGLLQALIPNEAYRALAPRTGDRLLLKPRRLEVFLEQAA